MPKNCSWGDGAQESSRDGSGPEQDQAPVLEGAAGAAQLEVLVLRDISELRALSDLQGQTRC